MALCFSAASFKKYICDPCAVELDIAHQATASTAGVAWKMNIKVLSVMVASVDRFLSKASWRKKGGRPGHCKGSGA